MSKLPRPEECGYVESLHDPKHKHYIGAGFCIICGGYGCTTPRTEDIAALERALQRARHRVEMLEQELEEAKAKEPYPSVNHLTWVAPPML